MAPDRELAHRPDLDLQARDGAAPAAAERAGAPDLSGVAAAVENLQARSTGQIVLTDETSKKESAAAGIAEPAQQLPHLDRIQASFGNHDLSGVNAHVGGQAATASRAIGAEGFAAGNHVAFAHQPDVFLAAHEAAHVVQQREGVHLKGGVGQAGDAHEQQADAVAERVVAGQSATDLLPGQGRELIHDPNGAAGMQLYSVEQIEGAAWRVSESGTTALKQDGQLQTLYATIDQIAAANVALMMAGDGGSYIQLVDGSEQMEVKGKSLNAVIPTMTPTGFDPDNKKLEDANKKGGVAADGSTGGKMALWSDCGRSSRTVMGTDDHGRAPKGQYQVGDEAKETARSYDPADYSNAVYIAAMPAFIQDKRSHPYLVQNIHYTGDLRDEWKAIKPTNPDHAREMYWELGDDGRLVFDAFAKINTAADPEVGGAYTMATEYNMPGSAAVLDDEGEDKPRWNFHWAGVIMKDGANNITLENYAIGFRATGNAAVDAANDKRAYDWTNRKWKFQMYGVSKEGQTFQEQHLDTGTHGTRASTFSAKVD